MYIYKIVNDVNGKIYVGQTIRTIESRFQDHLKSAEKGEWGHLFNAIRKYGSEHFCIELVCTASSQQELDELEDYYICLWDTIKNGYNMIRGGAHFKYGNPMHSEVCKARHDESMRSDEVRGKISETLKAYYRDNYDTEKEKEHRRRLSEQKKQLYASPEGEAVKAKQRASFKFTPEHFYAINSAKYKPVYCTDREGKLVAYFKCVKDASNWWRNDRGFTRYKGPLDDYIKKSFDRDMFIDDLHWYYGEPCAESIES